MTQRDDLVSRLKAVDQGSVEDCFLQSPLFTYAATALEAKDAEIARLRKVASSEGDAANKLLSRGLDLCDLSEELEAKLDAAEARIAELERQLAEKEK